MSNGQRTATKSQKKKRTGSVNHPTPSHTWDCKNERASGRYKITLCSQVYRPPAARDPPKPPEPGHWSQCPICGCNVHIDCSRSNSECALREKKEKSKIPCALKKKKTTTVLKKKKLKRKLKSQTTPKWNDPAKKRNTGNNLVNCRLKPRKRVVIKTLTPKAKINSCDLPKPENVASAPYLNFITAYCKKYSNIVPIEAVRRGTAMWWHMTHAQKRKYEFH